MPDTASDPPTDVAALQAMVLAQKAELATARSGLIKQRFEIEALKGKRFGGGTLRRVISL